MSRQLSAISFVLFFAFLGQVAVSLGHSEKNGESSYIAKNSGKENTDRNDVSQSDRLTTQAEIEVDRQIEKSKEEFYNNPNFKVKYSSQNWDKKFEKIKDEHPTKIGIEPIFTPYFGIGFGSHRLSVLNEGVAVDVAFGNRYAKVRPIAGVNVGLLHAFAEGKRYPCRSYSSSSHRYSNTTCSDIEGTIGNYARTSGRFGIILGESLLRNIWNRFFLIATADIGAIIPLNKNLKKVGNYTREAKLRSSFIGELGVTFGFSIFHTGLMYRYIDIMETHKERARNISQLLWTIGFSF